MAAIFEARGLTVRYGALAALTDVDVALEPGLVHGVIGPNGAGKSTFIDALSGRCRGRCRWRARTSPGGPSAGAATMASPAPSSAPAFFGSMTVRAQLDMVARRNDESDLDSIIDRLGLAPVADRVCSEIAYGTQLGRPRRLNYWSLWSIFRKLLAICHFLPYGPIIELDVMSITLRGDADDAHGTCRPGSRADRARDGRRRRRRRRDLARRTSGGAHRHRRDG